MSQTRILVSVNGGEFLPLPIRGHGNIFANRASALDYWQRTIRPEILKDGGKIVEETSRGAKAVFDPRSAPWGGAEEYRF